MRDMGFIRFPKWPGMAVLALAALLCCGCEFGGKHRSITMDEAMKMMAEDDKCLIVDVRTPQEYRQGHIPGAVLLPIEDIRKERRNDKGSIASLPDKGQVLLLYCRTGRRASDSAKMLSALGYRNVYEFGGIVDWAGEIRQGDEP